MTPSRRIYVDLDDVLCETARGFVDLLEGEFGRRVAFDDIHSFDLSRSFGLDAEELAEFMARAHEPDVMGEYQPMEGAIEAMEGWAGEGYELAVVTGRPPSARAVSLEWLDRYGIHHDSLIFVDKYSRTLQPGLEVSPLRLTDLEPGEFCLAVEDSLDMALHLAHRLQLPVSLLDRPWNRRVPATDQPLDRLIVRCRDWEEILGSYPRS